MILNTRPLVYDAKMQAALRGSGQDLLACPVLTARAVACNNHDDADALVFTSQIAVGFTPKALATQDFPVYAVGKATAAAATERGFSQVIDGGGTAETLLSVIDAAPFQAGLYLSAQHVSRNLAEARPDKIKRQVVYDMVPVNTLPSSVVEALASSDSFTVPFYSPRSFQVFEALIEKLGLNENLLKATAVAIHPRVLIKRSLPWGRTQIAETPDGSGMLAAIKAAA